MEVGGPEVLDQFLVGFHAPSLLPVENIIEEQPGLYPGQPDGHLHRHRLHIVVHLGHLEDSHLHVYRYWGSLGGRQVGVVVVRKVNSAVIHGVVERVPGELSQADSGQADHHQRYREQGHLSWC